METDPTLLQKCFVFLQSLSSEASASLQGMRLFVQWTLSVSVQITAGGLHRFCGRCDFCLVR